MKMGIEHILVFKLMILDRQCGISVVYLKKYREQISGSTLIIVYATLEKTDHQ